LNPRTGQPVQGVAACTAIAPSCLESDAMATACFVYGVEKSLVKFGARFPMRFALMPKTAAHEDWPIRQTASFPASGSNRIRD
jgi:thiamine biosynthesis lipoprotein ApbE